jgi:hypothetical protein
VGEVESGRDRQGAWGERLVAATKRRGERRIEGDCRAVIAAGVGVVEALLLTRAHAVGQCRIEQRLDSVHASYEAPAAHEHQGVAGGRLDRVAAPSRVPTCKVLDRDGVRV